LESSGVLCPKTTRIDTHLLIEKFERFALICACLGYMSTLRYWSSLPARLVKLPQ